MQDVGETLDFTSWGKGQCGCDTGTALGSVTGLQPSLTKLLKCPSHSLRLIFREVGPDPGLSSDKTLALQGQLEGGVRVAPVSRKAEVPAQHPGACVSLGRTPLLGTSGTWVRPALGGAAGPVSPSGPRLRLEAPSPRRRGPRGAAPWEPVHLSVR